MSTSSSNRADGGIDADVPDAMSCDSGTATIYYPDADADGFGGSAAVSSCEPLEGYVLTSGDCWDADDSNAAWAYPGQTSYFTAPMEVQNNAFDWNCDGQESYLHQECTTSFHPSCITPSKFGWLDSFPECGVTQNWCNSWDAEASNCLDSESRIQACN